MSFGTQLGYDAGQCTDEVASTLQWVGRWGNAWQWFGRARGDGFQTSSSPVIGSVAVWGQNVGGAGSAGHVAVVTGIQPNGLPIVQEMNWTCGPFCRDTRNVSQYSARGISGYILPPSQADAKQIQGYNSGQQSGSGVTQATLTGFPNPWPIIAGVALSGGSPIGGGLGALADVLGFGGDLFDIPHMMATIWADFVKLVIKGNEFLIGMALVGLGVWAIVMHTKVGQETVSAAKTGASVVGKVAA